MIRIIFSVFLFASVINIQAKDNRSPKLVSVPIDITSGWILIPVTIMDSTYHFIFDTGSYFSSWFNPLHNSNQKYPFTVRKHSDKRVRYGDNSISFESIHGTKGAISFREKRMGYSSLGISSKPDILKDYLHIDGILGLFDITQYYWLFDFKDQVVYISDYSLKEKLPTFCDLTINGRFGIPILDPIAGFMKLEIALNDYNPTDFILDTGSKNEGLAEIELLPTEWNRIPKELSQIISKLPSKEYGIKSLDSIRVNNYKIRNINFLMLDSENDPMITNILKRKKNIAGLISVDFCYRFSKMYYNKKKRRIQLFE